MSQILEQPPSGGVMQRPSQAIKASVRLINGAASQPFELGEQSVVDLVRLVLRMFLLLDRDCHLSVFPSLEAALEDLETIDLENNEYEMCDESGQRYIANILKPVSAFSGGAFTLVPMGLRDADLPVAFLKQAQFFGSKVSSLKTLDDARTYFQQKPSQVTQHVLRGWFGTRNERLYDVRYCNREGRILEATCKTSMLSGVYWTSDSVPFDFGPRSESGKTSAESTKCLACNATKFPRESRGVRSAGGAAQTPDNRGPRSEPVHTPRAS